MAARSLNKVQLIGHLGADPELRYTNTGKAVTTFSISTNDAWTDANGQAQEKTEWHKVVAWEKLGEIAGEYLAKGRQVYLEGKLQTRSYDDQKSGTKKYVTEIIAREIILLGKRFEQGVAAHDDDDKPFN